MAHSADLPGPTERRDVSARGIYLAGIGLLLILAIALGALYLIFAPHSSGPAIGLMRPDPRGDRTRFEAEETRKLETLGWTDRAAGLAHIPVADAMAIIAARGKLPEWPAPRAKSDECALLQRTVPRSPAADCLKGWEQWFGRTP